MRESFVIYTENSDLVDVLTDEQAGQVFKAIFHSQLGEDVTLQDQAARICFTGIIKQIERCNAKYDKRSEAGKKGMTSRWSVTKDNKTITTDNTGITTDNKHNINDNVPVNDNYKKDILSGKPAAEYPYKAITDYLNEKAGKAFLDKSKDTRKHIKARMDEGFTLDDFYKVIDNTVKRWKGDPKMCDYLRPSTLFGTKFESYLNMTDAAPVPKGKQVQFPQRSYDMKALEKALTGGGT